MKTKVLNFGSLNIDYVYSVDHFVRPGETIPSIKHCRYVGGKGCNQSIALALAGARVFHAGMIGGDGLFLKERLNKAGADTRFVSVVDGPSGHAIIQVNRRGENAILINGGANQMITASFVRNVLKRFGNNGILLLQNEISSIPEIMKEACRRGLRILFNPAPMTREVKTYPLQLVDCFIVNEIEGAELTGEKKPELIASVMRRRYPNASVVITLGSKGVLFCDDSSIIKTSAMKVSAVDTTAAGDTFTGYFVAGLAAGRPIRSALRLACKAAAICVTRPGAADSIPRLSEVMRR